MQYKWIVTPIPTTIRIATTCSPLRKIAIPSSNVSHKVNKILFSLSTGMPFLEKYECTYGARYLLPIISFTPRLDDLMKSQIARRRKGVVGRIGRNIPNVPNITHKAANDIYRYLTIFYYIRKDKPKTLKLCPSFLYISPSAAL